MANKTDNRLLLERLGELEKENQMLRNDNYIQGQELKRVNDLLCEIELMIFESDSGKFPLKWTKGKDFFSKSGGKEGDKAEALNHDGLPCRIHPDDRHLMNQSPENSSENRGLCFLKFFRVLDENGENKWYMCRESLFSSDNADGAMNYKGFIASLNDEMCSIPQIQEFCQEHLRKKVQRKNKDFTFPEQQVKELLKIGYTGKEIAKKLYVSESTVDRRKSDMFQKTDTKNTAQLLTYLNNHGL